MSRGLRPKLGMVCESPDASGGTLGKRLQVPDLEHIVVSGWDTMSTSLGDALIQHQVLSAQDIACVSETLLTERSLPTPRGRQGTQHDDATWGNRIEQLRQDIKTFQAQQQLDYVVVINAISTQPTPAWTAKYDALETFRRACLELDPDITPSMEYACAAILESAGYINFTPNIASVPAIQQLAEQNRVPLAGCDGKTGQTLLKTALAPVFKLRNLKVTGWFSTNLLGNRDGEALNEPEACRTKVTSKANCLDSILGYPVENHQVHIHYYRPRQDNKEAWDNIDVEGFLGYPMQLKIDFLCRDSILAAPLLIDMARLMTVSLREGESGLLPNTVRHSFCVPEYAPSSVWWESCDHGPRSWTPRLSRCSLAMWAANSASVAQPAKAWQSIS